MTARGRSECSNYCSSAKTEGMLLNFEKNENLYPQLLRKKKFSTIDPLVTKWQPPEVGAESTKIPFQPARAPPKVKRCYFGRFLPIPPPLRPNAIFCFWFFCTNFVFILELRIKKIRLKQKSTKVPFFAKLQWFDKTFQKSPKIGIFFASCPT